MTALLWIKNNWSWELPVLIVILTNVVNGLTAHPQLQTWLHVIIDRLSILTHADSPGTFKLPLKASPAPLSWASTTPSSGEKLSLLLPPLLFIMLGATPGCACWQPAHRNDTGCAVLHQIIDCSVDVIKGMSRPVAAIIENYLANNIRPDWDFISKQLEALGTKDGGCILAQLIADFESKMSTSPEAAHKAQIYASAMTDWKDKHGIPGVKYKLVGEDGKVQFK